MVSQTLVIEAHKKLLLHMFNLRFFRGLSCSAKHFHFVLVLLSVVFILVGCTQCAAKEVQNHCEFEACRSHNGNFDSPVRQHNFENGCHPSNLFCFPSTLSGFEDYKQTNADSEALDAHEVRSEGSSSRLNRKSINPSQLSYRGSFTFSGRTNISCSYHEDGFPEFPFDKKTRTSISDGMTESVRFIFDDGLSAPPVEIKPSILDWGYKNIHHPSLAYLTVKNLDADNILSVYDLSSSDPQFYPCNLNIIILAPGEEASICFIYFPTHLGSSSAKLIVQTSFGGFLIQAKGFSVESPYRISPLSGLDISSGGRWRKNLSLFNPFDEALRVEELTAWVSSVISGNNKSRESKYICRAHDTEYSGDYDMSLNANDWLASERAEVGKPRISLRPHKNWVVAPKETEPIAELDISGHFEGKVVGAFCMKLLRFSKNETDTVMVSFDTELDTKTDFDTGLVYLSLESLIPCITSRSIGVAVYVRNDGPCSLRVIKVIQVGESVAIFQIKSFEGLIIFPGTITRVAFVYYDARAREVGTNCKIVVSMNDTRFSDMEIPCGDVIGVHSGRRFDCSVGFTGRINVDYLNGGERFVSRSMVPSSGMKVSSSTREMDESMLTSWLSEATASSMSILEKEELKFPTVLVGNSSSRYVSVKNPGPKPVVTQLILNSGQVIDNCAIPEMSLVGNNNSTAPTTYGFSLAKDAIIEAFIHPYGNATLGPIRFQPSNRCEWRSSALIRNNLSGVEWLSLRAFGGSISLVLHEGYDPVQNLEFKLNWPSRLNLNTSYCPQSLTKEVYAKNTGDLPLEVIRIKVSGAECGSDGFFRIRNCTGFALRPGESTMLRILYRPDFTKSGTVRRDLQLVLTGGVMVIPMRASIPEHLLSSCKRSMFWIRAAKAMAVFLFATSLIYFIVFWKKGSSFPATRALNFLRTRFDRKIGDCDVLPKTNEIVRSSSIEETLLLGCRGNVDSSEVPPSSPSSVLNMDMQGALESRDLRVRVGKEKGRRRKKKRSSGVGTLLCEASSSQSSNSTPPSPLSPAIYPTPKKTAEARNPFSHAPVREIDGTTCSRTPSNLYKEVHSKRENKNRASFAHEKVPYLAKEPSSRAVPNAAVVSPSGGGGGTLPPWTCRSLLAPTSTIALHARAPGARLEKGKCTGLEEKTGVEQKYTYDIWGDHLFGLHLAYQSKNVSSNWSPVKNDSESFFVRGPQTLVKNSQLQYVVSDLDGNE